MAEKQLEFKLRNDTKGAVRYEETRDGEVVDVYDAVIGTLYVRKSGLKQMGLTSYPPTLTIVVKV